MYTSYIEYMFVCPFVLCDWGALKKPEDCDFSGFCQVSMMEWKLFWVQITQTDSGLPHAYRMKIGAVTQVTEGMAFQKERLVIFFNPPQLEIQSTVIKLQFLWLPTFAPEAVSEVFALHIHGQLPHLLLLLLVEILFYYRIHDIRPANEMTSAQLEIQET